MAKIPFCNHCGKPLNPDHKHAADIATCTCGFQKEIKGHLSFSEKESREKTGDGIVKEKETPGFPHVCKKCGYNECEIDDLGCAYSDESNIYLYKCKKCGYVERQADGSSNN